MNLKIILVFLIAFTGRLNANYAVDYAECTVVAMHDRRACREQSVSIAECLQAVDPLTGRSCCYDSTVSNLIPWCFVSADIYGVSASQGSSGSQGFAPPNQGSAGFAPPNQVSAGFAPPNQGSAGFAPPNQGSAGFAPPNQGSAGFAPPNQGSAGFAPPNQGSAGFAPPNQGPGFAPPNQGSAGFAPPNQGPSGFGPPNQGRPGFGPAAQLPGFAPPTFATTTPRTPSTSGNGAAANNTRPAVTFAPTSDLLGNTVPSGAVSNIFPTLVPGAGPEDPEVALQNLLIELGIETAPSINNPSGQVVLSGDINRTIALCTSVKNRQIPESVRQFFPDALSQCDSINATISPGEATAYLQREVNNILSEAQSGRTTPSPSRTTLRPPSNNFQNLLELVGGSNGGSSPGGSTNPLTSLLGTGGSTNPLTALLGGSNNGGTSGGSTNPLASLLGGGGGSNNALASLLGGGGGSNNPLASLLGGSTTTTAAPNPLLSLLGGTGGGGGTSSALLSLLGGSNSNGGGSNPSSSILQSLLGGSGGNSGGSSGLSSVLIQQLLQTPSPGIVRANEPIGAQLPDFLGTTPAPTYNPLVCGLLFGNDGLLSSLTSGGGTLQNFVFLPYRQNLLRQFGCLNSLFSNPLQLLSGGGIGNLRETLGPLLGLTSSTEDENIGNSASGPLDPSLIPPAILTRCLNERGSLNAQNNCKVGIHVNIRTEQECYNIGCIYADNGMCFRCPYVPVSAQVNQQAQPTCNVPRSERVRCPGFQTTYVISSIFNQQRTDGNNNAPASFLANGLGSRSGVAVEQANSPKLRQGIFGSLAGGLGGALGGGGNFQNQFLERECESRGCCWDADSSFFVSASSCFSKAQPTLPDSSANCLSTLSCGQTRSTILSRIIGGQTQASEDRPWQAIIRLRGTNVVRCSGVIICSQWIVTAASCLEKLQSITSVLGFALDLNPSSIEVYVGTSDPVTPLAAGQTVDVIRVIPHPFYSVSQNIHDIALIQVAELPDSLTVRPVCIPPYAASPIGNNVPIRVSGYGQSSSNVLQATLREITATTSDISVCRNVYQSSLPTGGVFCAVADVDGEDTCVGDGGSPAITFDDSTQTYTLVGINFAGSDDCSGATPMVFVDIAVYREWIRQTTNGCCSVIGGRLG